MDYWQKLIVDQQCIKYDQISDFEEKKAFDYTQVGIYNQVLITFSIIVVSGHLVGK